MRSTIRYVFLWMCLAFLVSHDSAGGGLGQARVVLLRGVLFSLFRQNIQIVYSYVYINGYSSNMYACKTTCG